MGCPTPQICHVIWGAYEYELGPWEKFSASMVGANEIYRITAEKAAKTLGLGGDPRRPPCTVAVALNFHVIEFHKLVDGACQSVLQPQTPEHC